MNKLDFIQPLDLIFFKGVDWISKLVSLGEKYGDGDASYTHVGMVINTRVLATIPEMEAGVLYLWESTVSTSASDPTDIETGKRRYGVQIRRLDEVIKSYDNAPQIKIVVGKIKDNPWLRREKESEEDHLQRQRFIRHEMAKLHEYFGRRTYSLGLYGPLAAVFPRLRTMRDDIDKVIIGAYSIFTTLAKQKDVTGPPPAGMAGWLFCSELVALILKNIHVLPSVINPEDITPVDLFGCQPRDCPNIIKEIHVIIDTISSPIPLPPISMLPPPPPPNTANTTPLQSSTPVAETSSIETILTSSTDNMKVDTQEKNVNTAILESLS